MNIVERAYQLARSGECRDLRDLERRRRREAFDAVPQHLNSPTLRRQLAGFIRAVRAGKQEAAE